VQDFRLIAAVGRVLAVAITIAVPVQASAQAPVVACDFDISDYFGTFTYGNTIHLVGRRGASSNVGQFLIVNGTTSDADLDKDGYATPGSCNYNDLFVARQTNLVNVENPSEAIPGRNIVINNLPRQLLSGQSAAVSVSVELPAGTAAGRYLGVIEIRDNVIFARPNGTADALNVDFINVEVIVAAENELTLLEADAAVALDSLVVEGRAGQAASGVFRIANTGNAPLSDVRISSSDLRSESAVGLVIRAENISFAPPSFASIGTGDTARVEVTVRLPRGLLNGRYRGTLFVQAADATPTQIPLVVIVRSPRGILFASNPVRASQGDIAQIAFNGDPGTEYRVVVFDMNGLLVFQTSGQVFAGIGGSAETPVAGADFAVNVGWPLVNGRGEHVASGMYLVLAESIVSGTRQLAKDKLMIIR
jgi:hypothetical protein